MREAENIREVEQLFTLHDSLFTPLMGFIFWPKSSRYVSERPEYLPTKCKRVGVFVDESLELVEKTATNFALDFIQLHGHEAPAYVASLKGHRLIKAFNIATTDDFAACIPYEGLVDYFLFDTKGKSVGGNGEKFDWSVLKAYHGQTPFLLSGGIGPDDASRIKAMTSGRACSRSSEQTSSLCSRSIAAFRHPRFAGIDLNSRFELSPALKDINKLKTFIQAL